MNTGRGEKWVVAQIVLLAAIGLAPAISNAPTPVSLVVGFILGALGVVFGTVAQATLGPNFTVFPKPRSEGTLIQTGPFQLVRHPTYTAGILVLFSWSLMWMCVP